MTGTPWEALFYEPELLDGSAGDADTGAAVGFYRSRMPPAARTVLDLGCGTGRLALPLAAAGLRVIAVDRSQRVLAFLRRKLAELPADARGRVAPTLLDIEVTPCAERVDAALASDDFLTHFLDVGRLGTVLRHVARSLPSGGRLFTDLRGREPERLRLAALPVPKPMLGFGISHGIETGLGPRSVAMSSLERFDASSRILVNDQVFEWIAEDGTVERRVYRTLRQRLHTLDEVGEAAAEAGFRVEAYWRFDRDRPPSEDAGFSMELEKL